MGGIACNTVTCYVIIHVRLEPQSLAYCERNALSLTHVRGPLPCSFFYIIGKIYQKSTIIMHQICIQSAARNILFIELSATRPWPVLEPYDEERFMMQ